MSEVNAQTVLSLKFVVFVLLNMDIWTQPASMFNKTALEKLERKEGERLEKNRTLSLRLFKDYPGLTK